MNWGWYGLSGVTKYGCCLSQSWKSVEDVLENSLQSGHLGARRPFCGMGDGGPISSSSSTHFCGLEKPVLVSPTTPQASLLLFLPLTTSPPFLGGGIWCSEAYRNLYLWLGPGLAHSLHACGFPGQAAKGYLVPGPPSGNPGYSASMCSKAPNMLRAK